MTTTTTTNQSCDDEVDNVPFIQRRKQLLLSINSTPKQSQACEIAVKEEEEDDDDDDCCNGQESVLLPLDIDQPLENHVSCQVEVNLGLTGGDVSSSAAAQFLHDMDLLEDGSENGDQENACIHPDDATGLEIGNDDDSSDSLADIDVPAITMNTDTFRDLTADDLDHIDLKERLKILLRRKFADKLAQEMAQEATEPVAKRMKLGVQSVDEESSVSHNQFSQISATNYCHGLAADSYSLEHDATESRHNVEKKRQTSSPKTILANLNSTKVYVPNASMNSSIQTSILPTSVHVKEELLEDSTGFGDSDWKVSTGFSFKPLNVKNEPEVQYEFNEDEVDHMQLSARMKLLPSGIESHLYNSNTFEYLAKVMPGPANEANLDYEKPIQASGPRKRKKTITDSVETAMEEDAPGLLKVLVDQGVSVDEIKLYSEPESNEALDESLCEDSFSELESVMSKLFPRQPSFIKFAAIGCTSTSKPTYSVACLFSLVEQARYVQYRNWPVEWGWCRDLQSFIFVFERHNRIVLERPEYGYATYFFELVDCLPIDWQIKRLVTAMKLSNCGRVSIIEDKPLLAGKDLTEGEAKVLMEYGWTPNTGLGTMLNYRDRVVHTRRNDTEMSEWRSKIGKYLSDGYNGGSIISSTVLNKDICQDADNSMQIKLEI
ncbi:hypothetical protein ACFE04_005840 [Oxalis oulophora]